MYHNNSNKRKAHRGWFLHSEVISKKKQNVHTDWGNQQHNNQDVSVKASLK